MLTQTEDSIVIQKTRELCQAILDEPELKSMRQKIDVFMANDQVRGQYESLMNQGQTLQEKQRAGTPLTDAEVGAFEKLRDSFLANPVGKGFIDAQEDMHHLQQSVTRYVSKTFELGRIPEDHELESGGCGNGGCGCSH